MPYLLEIMAWSMKWFLMWSVIEDVHYPDLLEIKGYDSDYSIFHLSFHIA